MAIMINNKKKVSECKTWSRDCDSLWSPVRTVARSVPSADGVCCWAAVALAAPPSAGDAALSAPGAFSTEKRRWSQGELHDFGYCSTWNVKVSPLRGSNEFPEEEQRAYLRNLISSFLVSLSVMIFDVVTLTSTPSTMNLRVFFNVFLWRFVSWKNTEHDEYKGTTAS